MDSEDGKQNLERFEEYTAELGITRDELAEAFICYGLDHKSGLLADRNG